MIQSSAATQTVWKHFRLLLFALTVSYYGFGQETQEEDPVDALLDDLFFSEEQLLQEIATSLESQSFIYTHVSFQSNTFFSGRESGVDQFNLVPQISYVHSSGFQLSASGVYYEEFDPHWDFTSLSAGYYNTLGTNNWFHYHAGYTRYFFSRGGNSFSNSLDISMGIRNSKRTLGTKVGISYLFGDDQSFQMASRSYAKVVLAQKKNFELSFRPRISFIVAQQTLALSQLTTQGGETDIRPANFDVFDLLNTQLTLPLSLTFNSWDLEAGYTLNFPNPVAVESDLKTTGFFGVSLGYLFDLKKKREEKD